MDERTRELIAIGASVSAHCQPCLEFHMGKARELAIVEDEIQEAIKIGHMVEKGAANAMKKFASQLFNQTKPRSGGCCSDGKSNCCG